MTTLTFLFIIVILTALFIKHMLIPITKVILWRRNKIILDDLRIANFHGYQNQYNALLFEADLYLDFIYAAHVKSRDRGRTWYRTNNKDTTDDIFIGPESDDLQDQVTAWYYKNHMQRPKL